MLIGKQLPSSYVSEVTATSSATADPEVPGPRPTRRNLIFAIVSIGLAAGVTGCGMGLSVPASNNASLQLAPDQVGAIAGLRGMFRQSGAITAVSLTTAIIARSHDPGLMQARVFVVFAALLVALPPVVWWMVPGASFSMIPTGSASSPT